MADNNVEHDLKKQHGEKFARVFRDWNLLDVPNLVHILEFAGRNPNDAEEIAKILTERYKKKEEPVYHTDKTPLELLAEAGYDAWYVTTEEEQNSIAGYFRDKRAVDHGATNGVERTDKHELLCTVTQNWEAGKKRFDEWYVIHAVKKKVKGDDKLPESEWHIKPSDTPQRQDEYGTSVISIQILKNGNRISIKNRYNHTVPSPDATFDNNPDNIIPGLSESLKKHFGVDFYTTKSPLPKDFCMLGEQFIKYNYEVNNVYFGSDYYLQNGTIEKLNSDYEYMLDYFILDARTGAVRNIATEYDCGADVLNGLFKNKKIKIQTNPEDKKEKHILADGVEIAVIKNGQIIELNLPGVEKIDDGFLRHIKNIKTLNAPDLRVIGRNFLNDNKTLTKLNTPKLQKISGDFLQYNRSLTGLNLPNLETASGSILDFNNVLTTVSLPKLKTVDSRFALGHADCPLSNLELPSLESVGDYFMSYNKHLKSINCPKLKTVGGKFLSKNEELQNVNAPQLMSVGDWFLEKNKKLESLSLPKLEHAGGWFIADNTILSQISLPNLEKIDHSFLKSNKALTSLSLPKLKIAKHNFLSDNEVLAEINLPHLEEFHWEFLKSNRELTELYLPELRFILESENFLPENESLVSLRLPKLEYLGCNVKILPKNKSLKELEIPDTVESRLYPYQSETGIVYRKDSFPYLKRLRMIVAKNNAKEQIAKEKTEEQENISIVAPEHNLDL